MLKNSKANNKWTCKNILTVLVLLLLINLPVISALELSEINVEDIKDDQATIVWNTDEPADSFVNYGVNKGGLQKIGDAKKTTNHEFYLNGLFPNTEYYYSVESDNLVDDNSGDYYSFKTLVPDTSAPVVVVDIPVLVAGVKTDITGWTEVGATVNLFVDGSLAGSTVAIKDEDGFVINSNIEEDNVVEDNIATEEIVEGEIVGEEPGEEIVVEETAVEETSAEGSLAFENTTLSETEPVQDSEVIAGQAIFDNKAEKPNGKFNFINVIINPEGPTDILIEAVDASGNKETFTSKVYSDSIKPKITLTNVSKIIDGSSFELQGTVSENVTYEVFIEDKSVAQGKGTIIQETISLEEGDNKIIVVAKDVAGWETTEEINVYADTQAPTVTMKIEKGNEYYQGRAVSSINGETEPGATVYLYIYRPIGYDYNPYFDRAWKKVTADQNGSFNFKAVDFEDEPVILEDLAPKLVPEGLQTYSISGVNLATDQQRWTYYVFVIAEDKVGKQGYTQSTVTINSCYSADWDFDVRSLLEFQRPWRLDPGLLDEGREQATAVFNLSYRGQGYAKTSTLSGQVQEDAFKVLSVDFDKACTQSMMEDDQFKLGCSIMQNNPSKIPNVDNTAWYLTYKLNGAKELSEGKDKFWNEFKKRQIVFPLKIRINYQEREANGNLGPTKTQTSCYDLSYFVDIPIDSAKMLPDWLADEGMDAIDFTIKQIDTILPYLQKAILVTGIGCISSFLGRMMVRWSRLFTSKLEVYFTRMKDKDEQCPVNQNTLYMESTVEHWTELRDNGLFNDPEDNKPRGEWDNPDQKTLDDLCPMTAGAWKLEAGLDQAYRWTCDRVFCRAVPAGWTASKSKEEVDTVVLSQNQCTASSRGIPLIEREKCGELIKENAGITNPTALAESKMKNGEFTCYQNGDKLYIITSEQKSSSLGEIVRLKLVHGFGYTLGQGSSYIGASDLLAYKPPNAEQYIVGQDQSCANACRNPKKPGYAADLINSVPNYKSESATTRTQNGCYKEVYVENTVSGKTTLKDEKGNLMGVNKFSAGYTNDCFVDFERGAANEIDTNKVCGGAPDCTGAGEECRSVTLSDGTKENHCVIIRSSSFDRSKLDFDCTSDSDCNSGNSTGLACRGNVCVYKDPYNFGDISVNKPQNSSYTGLLQCVCTVDEKATNTFGARTAAKEKTIGGKTLSEDWIYRQAEMFKESKSLAGTYYPEWRYYNSRDFSSAFGGDYVIDYLRTNKTVAKVDPKTQFLGAYQTVCLSVIRGHLIILKSILEGLRNCIDQAKHTGLTDAGVCKTIFAQHVCGLVYKAIAYFFTDCSPYSMNDEKKEGVLGGIGEVFSAGFGSIGESMDSSIDDIKNDYGNAQLNQFFATGAQGFTESLCMFAFGYDWPLGMDFILDSAYAVEMKSTVMVFPAERELATFNPATGTAVYNYNIGALVLPGCEIKSADVYLKCVGPEDQGHPGIQCGKQGCDCLYAREYSGVESEKTQYLESGRLINLKSGSFVDLKIPAPQKVDSSYRYDHVVVDLKLGPYSNAENCFDEGYKDGRFYFPIIDISPPAEFICQVQPTTGKYFCPEVQKMFGNGNGGYLEDPYITCYNKNTESFDDCSIPNLFTEGDAIRAKVHVFTDGEPYCLRVTTQGLGERDISQPKTLAKNLPGPYGVEINLGSVTPDLFSGASNSLTLTTDSDISCERQFTYVTRPTGAVSQVSYSFTYIMDPITKLYRVVLPPGVTARDHQKVGDYLTRMDGNNQFTGDQLKEINFILGEFEVRGIIGFPSGQKPICKYQVGQAAGANYAQDKIPLKIKAELLMSENGCFDASIPVKAPAFGLQQAEKNIMLQLNPLAEQITSKMHQEFMQGNCQAVLSNADEIINRQNFDGTKGMADMAEVLAIYYSVACHVVSGNNWQAERKDQICTLLKFFFTREYAFGQKAKAYPLTVNGTREYQKISKYLNEIGNKLNCGVSFSSSGSTVTSGTTGTALMKCGIDSANFTKSGFMAGWRPENWENYVCKEDIGSIKKYDSSSPNKLDLSPACWAGSMYTTGNDPCSGPSVQLCCPPGDN